MFEQKLLPTENVFHDPPDPSGSLLFSNLTGAEIGIGVYLKYSVLSLLSSI